MPPTIHPGQERTRRRRGLQRTGDGWSLPGRPHCSSFQILGGMDYRGLFATDPNPRGQTPRGKSLDDHQAHLCAHFRSPTDRTVLRPPTPPHPQHPVGTTFHLSRHHRKGSRPCHPPLHHRAEYAPAPAAETFYKKLLVTPAFHLTNNPPTHQDCSLQPMASGDCRRTLDQREDGRLSKVGHHCPPEAPLARPFLRPITPAIHHFRISTPMSSLR